MIGSTLVTIRKTHSVLEDNRITFDKYESVVYRNKFFFLARFIHNILSRQRRALRARDTRPCGPFRFFVNININRAGC